jgi:hypothetical protein
MYQYISTKLAQHSETFIHNGRGSARIEKSFFGEMGGVCIEDHESGTSSRQS